MAATALHYSGDFCCRLLDLAAHIGLAWPLTRRGSERVRQTAVDAFSAALADKVAGVRAGVIYAGHVTSPRQR